MIEIIKEKIKIVITESIGWLGAIFIICTPILGIYLLIKQMVQEIDNGHMGVSRGDSYKELFKQFSNLIMFIAAIIFNIFITIFYWQFVYWAIL